MEIGPKKHRTIIKGKEGSQLQISNWVLCYLKRSKVTMPTNQFWETEGYIIKFLPTVWVFWQRKGK